jgi:hypothetical protein
MRLDWVFCETSFACSQHLAMMAARADMLMAAVCLGVLLVSWMMMLRRAGEEVSMAKQVCWGI